ncbi:DUF7455 domain-containing protein [Pseudactinotalea sp.]|uniref:DUF7455 domain-containing protein n=1 Tax=Pseudactinotalea sp. TaxID=1926260 RepID=UPI003B3A4ED0
MLFLTFEEATMNVVEVAADECDACPTSAHVRAFLYAEMPSGHSLAYCAHHGTEYIDALIAQHATIVDLRHMVHA